MTGLAAVVATAAGSTAVQTKGRAVSLNMTQSLAVVALLGWGRNKNQSSPVYSIGYTLGSLLSVVRGCGQALDSCPVEDNKDQ